MATEAAPTDRPNNDAPMPEVAEGKAGRRWLAILAAAVMFTTGSVGGAYVAGLLDPLVDSLEQAWEKEEAVEPSGPPVYFNLPEMKVDLKPVKRRHYMITLIVVMELSSEDDKARLQEFQPRIIDAFQTYLRDQDRVNLVGKVGAERVRLEFLTIVNDIMAPTRARNVLFKKILLQ